MLKWFLKWNPKWNPKFRLFGFNFKMALKNRCQNHVKMPPKMIQKKTRFSRRLLGFFHTFGVPGFFRAWVFSYRWVFLSRGFFMPVFFHNRTTESKITGSLSIKCHNAHVLPCNKHIAINGGHQLLET